MELEKFNYYTSREGGGQQAKFKGQETAGRAENRVQGTLLQKLNRKRWK